MFFSLFLKECKQILKSLVFYIYLIIFILFITSQMGTVASTFEGTPQPGQEYYGWKTSQDENLIMERALASLVQQVVRGEFFTYPLGFYKNVIPNEEELNQIRGYIEECTGKDFDIVLAETEAHFGQYDQQTMEVAMAADGAYRVEVKEGLDIDTFYEYMDKVCQITGKGSAYEQNELKSGISVLMTYEDALEEYETMRDHDRITGAYARLFCDYAGIVLSLLPVFLGVSRAVKDKRSKVADVIFSKEISSGKLMWSRFLSNVTMIFLPVLVIAELMQAPIAYLAVTYGITPDLFACLRYSVIWLLPEIMAVLALSFFLTELTDSIIGIFVQVAWAFTSLMGAGSLVGGFGLNLVARWNTVGNTLQFLEQQRDLYVNRGFYVAFSLVLMLLTVWIYDWKRKEGVTLYGKIRQLRA